MIRVQLGLDVVVGRADLVQHVAGRVDAVVLDQPARAFGQPEHQHEHDQRGDGGGADRDAPVNGFRRLDDGRDDDADADPHLEGEYEDRAAVRQFPALRWSAIADCRCTGC